MGDKIKLFHTLFFYFLFLGCLCLKAQEVQINTQESPLTLQEVKNFLKKPVSDPKKNVSIFSSLLEKEPGAEIEFYLIEQFKLNKSVEYEIVLANWLNHFPEIIPFFNIDLIKAPLIHLLDENPMLYSKLNLSQKQDPELIEVCFFHTQNNLELRQEIFQYASVESQYELLIYNGLLLDFAEPIYKDDLKWVYRAVLQNADAIYYASQRIQRLFGKTGLEKLNSPHSKWNFLQFKLQEKKMMMMDIIISIWDSISETWLNTVSIPIHYLLGFDHYLASIETVPLEEIATAEPQSLILNRVIHNKKTLDLIRKEGNMPLLDARILSKNNLVQAMVIKEYNLNQNIENYSFVLFDGSNLIKFPFSSHKRDKQYLYRPGDEGRWDPFKLNIKRLEKRSLGFHFVFDWESDFGTLTTSFRETKSGVIRENIAYQPVLSDASL